MAQRITNNDLKAELQSIKECSEENHRALRGNNGELGLVGRVAVIEQAVKDITQKDLPSIEKRILREVEAFKDLYVKDTERNNERNIQWPIIARSFIFPTVLAVITALAVSYVVAFFGP